MTLPPVLRTRLWLAAAAVLAVVLGSQIANEELMWPSLVTGLLAAVVLTRTQSYPLGTLILGCSVFGYIVGNRGFAQISLAGRIPLLPAEFVLLGGGSILLVQCAYLQKSPWRWDALNLVIILWMALSSARLYFDVRRFGAMALRDYATVYYAAFFFLAQEAGKTVRERLYLRGCLFAAYLALLVVYPLFMLFPDFFIQTLTLRGNPIFFLKDDLAGTFMAAGSIFFFIRYEKLKSRWSLVPSLLLAVLTVVSKNRASLLGLVVAAVLLAIGGRRRFLMVLGGSALAGAVILLAAAWIRNEPWEKTALHDVYERVVSIGDSSGEGHYSGDDTFYKGDNNVFRIFWWQVLTEETLRTNPWTGMGWGYDLSSSFAQQYYPEGNSEFSTRSPHCIFMTLFARTGLVGLVPFLAIIGIMAVQFFRSIRRNLGDPGLWAGAWAILTSAAFGVVLEGPMGAVVFWSMLGLAHAYDLAPGGPPGSGAAFGLEIPEANLPGTPQAVLAQPT